MLSDTDGRSPRLVRFDSFAAPINPGVPLELNRWYFIGFSIAGTGTNQVVVYIKDLEFGGETTYTGTSAAAMTGTPSHAALGSALYEDAFKGRMQAARIWNVALTAAEMAACAGTSLPVSQTAACVNDLPMADATLANNYVARTGSDWTPSNTLTVEANAPISDGAITGTIAATDGATTAALSGSVGLTGTIAATDAATTAALTGSVGLTGTAAATDGATTAAVSGAVGLSGSIGATDGSDQAAVVGEVAGAMTGSVAAVEARDGALVIGTVSGLAPEGGGGPDADWEPAGPHAVPRHMKPKAPAAVAPKVRRKRAAPAAAVELEAAIAPAAPAPPVAAAMPKTDEAVAAPAAQREPFAKRALRLVMLVDALDD